MERRGGWDSGRRRATAHGNQCAGAAGWCTGSCCYSRQPSERLRKSGHLSKTVAVWGALVSWAIERFCQLSGVTIFAHRPSCAGGQYLSRSTASRIGLPAGRSTPTSSPPVGGRSGCALRQRPGHRCRRACRSRTGSDTCGSRPCAARTLRSGGRFSAPHQLLLPPPRMMGLPL
jgi:hypothetical protein